MNKSERIIVFIATAVFVAAIFGIYRAEFALLSVAGVIVVSALLMMAFTVLFAEHYFTRPTDVVSSTVAILLLLAPLHRALAGFGAWYWIFASYNAGLLLIALTSLPSIRSPAKIRAAIDLQAP